MKGVWENPYGSKEVAIKLLKPNAEENDKVAFLQEAAVLSQFRHAHIVKCLGAVTLKEPVSVILAVPRKHVFYLYIPNYV